MTHNNAKKDQAKQADILCKKTHFKKQEVEGLVKIFKDMTKNTPKMERTKFRDCLHNTFGLTDDILMDRVFKAFDIDNDSYINKDEWVIGLSVFLKGTLEEKLKYCFTVYDLNGDGYIQREEIFHMLKSSLVKQSSEEDGDESVKDLVEISIRKMDFDHDGRLSFADFRESVLDDSLLLEAFGKCLPEDKHNKSFRATFSEDAGLLHH